ncbi:uncharacterized protein LOC143239521 [Tachypleus tridentatus]|uniref:uncharacterized protein LOC143239521 n=1 Tax=Tachypleus tridentatus TaxID=6853 RepID=UPI003FD3EE00
MLIFVVYIRTVSLQTAGNSTTSRDQLEGSHRNERRLSLLTIVRFPNDPCKGKNGLTGTCYNYKECFQKRGTIAGTCAYGFGICCTFLITCGKTSKENVTYFVDPAYRRVPSRGIPVTCKIIIRKLPISICQYRLDFQRFELSQPLAGDCGDLTDNFVFTLDGRKMSDFGLPSCGLCGNLTGQHVYLDVGTGNGQLELEIKQGINTPSTSGQRKWLVKISQLPCSASYLASSGCLQYFLGPSGHVSSFNYGVYGQGNTAYYFNNLQYTACVRGEAGYCSIRWEALGADFDIGQLPNANTSGVGDMNCKSDYEILPSGSDVTRTLGVSDRFCGSVLNPVHGKTENNPIISKHRPFEVRMIADDNDVSRGFNLNFTQIPCN